MEQYAFTVKVTQQHSPSDVNSSNYDTFFKNLRNRGITIVLSQSEYDPKGFLHYHGIIECKRNFYRKKLRIAGYHLYLKEIDDLQGWVAYCLKDVKQKFFEPLYPYNYSFTGALTAEVKIEEMAKELLHKADKKQMKIYANNIKVIKRARKWLLEDTKHTHAQEMNDDDECHDIQKALYSSLMKK